MPIQRFFNKKDLEPFQDRTEYIGQLFKMAHSDGHMDECEYHFILKVAQRLELEVDFEDLHNNIDHISFDGSACRKFGFDLLFDLSWMMLVDGEVDRKELALGVDLATKMGFQAIKVQEIITAIGDQKRLGLPPAEIKEKLQQQFKLLL